MLKRPTSKIVKDYINHVSYISKITSEVGEVKLTARQANYLLCIGAHSTSKKWIGITELYKIFGDAPHTSSGSVRKLINLDLLKEEKAKKVGRGSRNKNNLRLTKKGEKIYETLAIGLECSTSILPVGGLISLLEK